MSKIISLNEHEFSSYICCSSPGKIILFGEHAVVYGTTAVLGSISRRTRVYLGPPVNATSSENKQLIIRFGMKNESISIEYSTLKQIYFSFSSLLRSLEFTGNLPFSEKQFNVIDEAISKFAVDTLSSTSIEILPSFSYPSLKCLFMNFLCMHFIANEFDSSCALKEVPSFVELSTDLPYGCGLGSSASYSSALAASFLLFYKIHSKDTPSCNCHHFKNDYPLCNSQKVLINQWAFEGERMIHGSPSGADNYASVFGGIFSFKRKTDNDEKCCTKNNLPYFVTPLASALHNAHFSQMVDSSRSNTSSSFIIPRPVLQSNIHSLSRTVSPTPSSRSVSLSPSVSPSPSPTPFFRSVFSPPLYFIVVNSQEPRITSAEVKKVKELREREREATDELFESIEAISQRGFTIMGECLLPSVRGVDRTTEASRSGCEQKSFEGDEDLSVSPAMWKELGQLMEENHKLLQSLDVSHPTLEKIRSILSSFGIPSKLTGAGGGGCVVGLLPVQLNAEVLSTFSSQSSSLSFGSFSQLSTEDSEESASQTTSSEKPSIATNSTSSHDSATLENVSAPNPLHHKEANSLSPPPRTQHITQSTEFSLLQTSSSSTSVNTSSSSSSSSTADLLPPTAKSLCHQSLSSLFDALTRAGFSDYFITTLGSSGVRKESCSRQD
ncbi:putative mevalonate kinase [Monocercomonoides exilis]|uniref:putative mevalonate kinase n=1 Tax=Monocercomonoides exilis TaxID=2049356 RepID=UPI00355AA698|nr:putative mevalonate kinase [Monocercomonoides exilis]|eukprot:MONOS_15309.1-p1 / transcript=MONOS_15309.1 / gene=MONOS_15309 / organism=Monocercomonoides_exilis_PA203 / gene_product=mevalonate kinase / transcript_product=mevalonate kinase / location=Mono_scaffold01194:11427-13427(-) / protein_length=666 / sequence_SO=supercontig / SO=protein_coding / is_pseudo=false